MGRKDLSPFGEARQCLPSLCEVSFSFLYHWKGGDPPFFLPPSLTGVTSISCGN